MTTEYEIVLRDRFAACALVGILASFALASFSEDGPLPEPKYAATRAWQFADEMMKGRNGNGRTETED